MQFESATSPREHASDVALDEVRRLLRRPERRNDHWGALAAAALFAAAAIGFAAASVLAPPTTISPAAKTGVR
jgi:hypothetical protein